MLNPDSVLQRWTGMIDKNLQLTIQKAFDLPPDDNYVYRVETLALTLLGVQAALESGKYRYWYSLNHQQLKATTPIFFSCSPLSFPAFLSCTSRFSVLAKKYPQEQFQFLTNSPWFPLQASEADITAYTTIFSPSPNSTPAKALTSFSSNAKKATARATVALYLQSRLVSPPPALKPPKPPKATSSSSSNKGSTSQSAVKYCNPYLDVWAWTCHETGFVGPFGGDTAAGGYAAPESARITHPVVAVLYHHFGCVCPSAEALGIIAKAVSVIGGGGGGGKAGAGQQEGDEREGGVVEIGSGNGYWAYLLRRMGVPVIAVDNMSALWRMMWITDTERADGVDYLRRHGGMKERVLLMVYMVTKGEFTKRVLKAYKGDTVVVAGTQNENRFTGFADMTVEEYFEREKKDFEMTVRVPLPSFAGKDEALYVYQRKK